ncbi:MATE family efflux transporter [Anseongella ginsenosidimutans]|uniref:MATE family efflux transporter n=1 Tax=Anseongella ginsenosidimutans TaxID=496056 RepID=UPI001A9E97A7|nr:MATE family efflux transporter [Anseongella ginsenosidimutans]
MANASVPLLGLADTAAIGRTATARELGAIALGALVFSFVYWSFGFLRMGTTGFIAQAAGARDDQEARLALTRALLLGLGIGVVLVLFQSGICWAALRLLSASDEVSELVKRYFFIRIWGAPATLATFALLGALIGLGHTRKLLITQLFLNGVNVCLNLFFVFELKMGVEGIALGTLIAEWAAFGLALWLVLRSLHFNLFRFLRKSRADVLRKGPLLGMLKTNSDIMIRTLALLGGFAWFTNQGAKFGDATLAANHVLLQFVSLSAFFLDGFAYVVEMLTGRALGAKDRSRFIRDVKNATQLAGGTALLLALMVWTFGRPAISFLTRDAGVQEIAGQHLSYAAIYIAISFFAFQLDGVFIGAIRSREMRNASIASLLLFIGLEIVLTSWTHNNGLWLAFIAYVFIRGITLYLYLPRLMESFRKPSENTISSS